MAKSMVEKQFTAWARKRAAADECSRCAKSWAAKAEKYAKEGDAEWAKKCDAWAKSEEKNAAKYQAAADALYTDDVRKEREARENFLNVFHGFINEWAVKFTDIAESAYNKRKTANNQMWDELTAAGYISGSIAYKKSDIYKTYLALYGKEVAEYARIEREFNRENSMKNNLDAVTSEVLKMRYRVVEYVGTPVAIESESWSEGGIEGIITGTDGRCYLRSIWAGGYNIQCLHIRMIVTKLA